MDGNKVSVLQVAICQAEIDRINAIPLADLILTDGEKTRSMSEKEIEEYRFIGLTNFFLISGGIITIDGES